jgi:hypothetical protein
MKRWTPIKYRDFYDIPRIFLAETPEQVFLFDCPFNEEQDEYETTFKVYLMPAVGEQELAGSWKDLPRTATRLLGEIRTSDVEFDPTLRQQVNLEVVSRLGF